MVVSSCKMIDELRKLKFIVKLLGLKIRARWIPQAINCFTDILSRALDSSDFRGTESLVESIRTEFSLNYVACQHRQLHKHPTASRKYLISEIYRPWSDGVDRLWTPQLGLLPLIVQKIATDKAKGVLIEPHWTSQDWYECLKLLSSRTKHIEPPHPDGKPLLVGERKQNPAWGLVVVEIMRRLPGWKGLDQL